MQWWWNSLRSFLNKFAAKSCKRFPPHLNSISTLSCETWNAHRSPHILQLRCSIEKLQNLSNLICDLQIRQIWIQLITTCGKYMYNKSGAQNYILVSQGCIFLLCWIPTLIFQVICRSWSCCHCLVWLTQILSIHLIITVAHLNHVRLSCAGIRPVGILITIIPAGIYSLHLMLWTVCQLRMKPVVCLSMHFVRASNLYSVRRCLRYRLLLT